MLSFILDNSIMLTVCVINIACLKKKGSMLQIQYNLNVVLYQLFIIASDSQQLKQIQMIIVYVSLLYYIRENLD